MFVLGAIFRMGIQFDAELVSHTSWLIQRPVEKLIQADWQRLAFDVKRRFRHGEFQVCGDYV